MAILGNKRNSERRAEHLLNDLLSHQGWELRRPPLGDVLFQHEYKGYPELSQILAKASKKGEGSGIPEAILVDRSSTDPLAVIEAKAAVKDIGKAISEAQGYAKQFIDAGYNTLAIGLAGTTDHDFRLLVHKWTGKAWVAVTYDGTPIGWIPTRENLDALAQPKTPAEIRPTIPPPEVLAQRADEINRLLREANVKDEFRPAVVAAIMLALWKSRGELRRDKKYILKDINSACQEAFLAANKAGLAKSLRVDEANEKLAERARRIAVILERLNVTVLTAEHDYLGQLYETFFRYTGGNTIGQYFTPRHVAKMMVEICGVTKDDVVLDPACGTGGFLVASMDRILREHRMTRAQVVKIVQKQLIGFESEPVTAALCVANMILRGDGSTGIHRGDAFTIDVYPKNKASVGLMNPPFPHKKTDTPVEDFVLRALDGIQRGGTLAVILPTSLLVKKEKAPWRELVLKHNTLTGVCQLPNELFEPFASATTSIVFIEKGVPHNPRKKSVFVRLHHDGFSLRKGVRVYGRGEPDQIDDAIDAILNRKSVPGFSAMANVAGTEEWAVGAYIESAPAEDAEIKQAVDVLLRRLASFYTRYAAEIIQQRKAIDDGELNVSPYRMILSEQRITNAAELEAKPGTVGGCFEIFYGMKELHSREGIANGPALIISPTEEYNGCYGWLDFKQLIAPPFVTVAQTGSIGEAFVQLEPCAVNDDCLVLLPKKGVSESTLVIATAAIHAEKWRFTYGRKLTPNRIASFALPTSRALDAWVKAKLVETKEVIAASLKPYQSRR